MNPCALKQLWSGFVSCSQKHSEIIPMAIYHNHSLSQQHAVGALLSLQPEETATAGSLMI